MILLSNYRSNSILKDIVRLVKSKPPSFFQIKKLRGYSGWCVWDDKSTGDHIQLDYRDKLLSTAIHECVHYLFPEWSESQVRYTERRIVNTTDTLSLSKLLIILTTKIHQCEVGKSRAIYAKKRATKKK